MCRKLANVRTSHDASIKVPIYILSPIFVIRVDATQFWFKCVRYGLTSANSGCRHDRARISASGFEAHDDRFMKSAVAKVVRADLWLGSPLDSVVLAA